MKTYVKPTLEFIELRPEERLAGSSCAAPGKGGDGDCKGQGLGSPHLG